jgi:hypothetical protein
MTTYWTIGTSAKHGTLLLKCCRHRPRHAVAIIRAAVHHADNRRRCKKEPEAHIDKRTYAFQASCRTGRQGRCLLYLGRLAASRPKHASIASSFH